MYLALRSGLRRFTPVFTVPALLGMTTGGSYISRTGLLPAVAGRSKTVPLCMSFVTPCRVWCPCCRSHDPGLAMPPGLPPARFRLIPFRSPLLRESLLLSFPRGTEMFQFPRFPPPALCVHAEVTPHDGCRVSPFGHPRIDARSAAPRGLSQPPTSFFGIRRQGIHRWLFIAWRTKMLVLAMEFSRSAPATRAVRRPGAGRRERTQRPRPPHRGGRGRHTPSQRNRGGPIQSVAGVQARPEGLEPAR